MGAFQDWYVKERVARIARSYQRAGHPVTIHQYAIEVPFGNLIAGASSASPVVIKIPAEADFAWLGQTMFPHGVQGNAAGSKEYPDAYFVRVTIAKGDITLGRSIRVSGDFDNEWIPVGSFCGSGRLPFFWPFPLILAGGDVIKFEGSNITAGARDISLTLLGVQLYRRLSA